VGPERRHPRWRHGRREVARDGREVFYPPIVPLPARPISDRFLSEGERLATP
jgi:hypothetical protein